eukprot:TRINITY_DN22576_c0_g1_i1.p1 TRINITY_DN22576_c0_g1~~TRINITY_DN22576_c0_g1_i1.p1  ORF type:complete len:1154 (+),score=156.01 TRINITY_DN22576_c0_g1_i1:77-3538(+)
MSVRSSAPLRPSRSAAPRAGSAGASAHGQHFRDRLEHLEGTFAAHRAEFVDHRDEVEQALSRLGQPVRPEVQDLIDQLSLRLSLLEEKLSLTDAQVHEAIGQQLKQSSAIESVEVCLCEARAHLNERRIAIDSCDDGLRALCARVDKLSSNFDAMQERISTHTIPQLHRALAAVRKDITRLREGGTKQVSNSCRGGVGRDDFTALVDAISRKICHPSTAHRELPPGDLRHLPLSEVAVSVKQLEKECADTIANAQHDNQPGHQTRAPTLAAGVDNSRRTALQSVPENLSVTAPLTDEQLGHRHVDVQESLVHRLVEPDSLGVLECVRSWHAAFIDDTSEHVACAIVDAGQRLEDEVRSCAEATHDKLFAEFRSWCEEERNRETSRHRGDDYRLVRVEDEMHSWSERVLAGIEQQQSARDTSIAATIDEMRCQLERHVDGYCQGPLEELSEALTNVKDTARSIEKRAISTLSSEIGSLKASSAGVVAKIDKLDSESHSIRSQLERHMLEQRRARDAVLSKDTVSASVSARKTERIAAEEATSAVASELSAVDSCYKRLSEKVDHLNAKSHGMVDFFESRLRAECDALTSEAKATAFDVGVESAAALSQQISILEAYSSQIAAKVNQLDVDSRDVRSQLDKHISDTLEARHADVGTDRLGTLVAARAAVRAAGEDAAATFAEEMRSLEASSVEIAARVSQLDADSRRTMHTNRREHQAQLEELSSGLKAVEAAAQDSVQKASEAMGARIASEIAVSNKSAMDLATKFDRLDADAHGMRCELATLRTLRADMREEFREFQSQESPKSKDLLRCDIGYPLRNSEDVLPTPVSQPQRELRLELMKAARQLQGVGVELCAKQHEMQQEMRAEMAWCSEAIDQHQATFTRELGSFSRHVRDEGMLASLAEEGSYARSRTCSNLTVDVQLQETRATCPDVAQHGSADYMQCPEPRDLCRELRAEFECTVSELGVTEAQRCAWRCDLAEALAEARSDAQKLHAVAISRADGAMSLSHELADRLRAELREWTAEMLRIRQARVPLAAAAEGAVSLDMPPAGWDATVASASTALGIHAAPCTSAPPSVESGGHVSSSLAGNASTTTNIVANTSVAGSWARPRSEPPTSSQGHAPRAPALQARRSNSRSLPLCAWQGGAQPLQSS